MNSSRKLESPSGTRTVQARQAAAFLMAVASMLLGSACRTGAGGESSPSAPPALAVSLARAACFGSCPVYTVELFDDGGVRFEGRAHVADTGSFSARVPSDSVQSLVRSLRASPTLATDGAWVEGAPACGRHVPDGPRFTLVVHAGGPARTVRFDAGCTDAPRSLAALAEAVDRTANTRQWILGIKESN